MIGKYKVKKKLFKISKDTLFCFFASVLKVSLFLVIFCYSISLVYNSFHTLRLLKPFINRYFGVKGKIESCFHIKSSKD
jgi:hypothetical protein